MGTWGIKNFDNETASDFVYQILEGDHSLILNTLEKAYGVEHGICMDAKSCEEALVVMEFLAGANGNPSLELFTEAQLWLRKNDPFGSLSFDERKIMLSKAMEVLQHITGNSELKALWERSGEYEKWMVVQERLKARLS